MSAKAIADTFYMKKLSGKPKWTFIKQDFSREGQIHEIVKFNTLVKRINVIIHYSRNVSSGPNPKQKENNLEPRLKACAYHYFPILNVY